MAPGALQGRWPRLEVLDWDNEWDCAATARLAPADVWIESFGCALPVELLEHRFDTRRSNRPDPGAAPIWINLEYLSAEGFVERTHCLPSPVMYGPASGQTKFFFNPGFSIHTGGLLRESGLAKRLATFDRTSWLESHAIGWHGERLISLFCYAPAALEGLLERLQRDTTSTQLLVTHGRAAAAVRRVLGNPPSDLKSHSTGASGSLSVTFLAPLSQTDFDHLLWSCDLNFVRGEDSLVRAIWAQKPFVWQIYPQHDNAHHTKLAAFLQVIDAPRSLRQFHHTWNGIDSQVLQQPDLTAWTDAALKAGAQLLHQTDLTTGLLKFVEQLGQVN